MKVPVAYPCGRCDFSSGQRGMDRCSACGGTGSVFKVLALSFPNTKEGYEKALKHLNVKRSTK